MLFAILASSFSPVDKQRLEGFPGVRVRLLVDPNQPNPTETRAFAYVMPWSHSMQAGGGKIKCPCTP